MSMWDEVRRDFPVLERYAYLDAAAASPTSRPVGEAVARFYSDLSHFGDLPWNGWLEQREAIRERIARFIGATSDEIVFTSNTSSGVNLVVDHLADDGPLLTTDIEFPTVTLPWIHRGVPVHFLPAKDGRVLAADFAAGRAPDAATIAVSHVQFSNGYRLDLTAFGAIKQTRSLVVSASQSCGAFPIDVGRDRVDALAAGGHKWLCAGYGTGFAYIAKSILDRRPPLAVGWMSGRRPFDFDPRAIELLPSARRSELGCPAFAVIVALGAAVDYLAAIGIEVIEARILELTGYLRARLADERFDVLTPPGEPRSGSTLVALPNATQATRFLRSKRVIVSPKPRGVRVATHIYNSESDIDACVAAIRAWRDQGAGSGDKL